MNQNFETIGKVNLDLTYYPGEDYYCDGAVEDELLTIARDHSPEEFDRIIEEKKDWPILYHLSGLRQNIISWIPEKNSKILEVGAGCGAITGALSAKASELTCIDLSKKRSQINAYRNRNLENVTIKVGNFQDIEPHLDTDYDLICLIGVFEYAKGYIGNETPYTEFLNIIKKHCKPGGRIIIAIENRMGLKYFAGCREDHLGDFFSGIEDYQKGGVVRTFTRPALEKIFKQCGAEDYTFYYPYPDYKFAHTIYSDKRLPRVGELTTNLRNFDRDRIQLFDEKNAFDSIIRDGEFPLFSNSYLVVLGPDYAVDYSKFSNDRAAEYSIRTDIVPEMIADRKANQTMQTGNAAEEKNDQLIQDEKASQKGKEKEQKDYFADPEDNTKCVIKTATDRRAAEHLNNIYKAYGLLQKRFEGSGLVICPCELVDGALRFPFLQGETLEEKMDQCLSLGDKDGFEKLLGKYIEFVSYHAEEKVTDMDLIFQNILIDENGTWQVIDYEWTVEEARPYQDIVKRALYCYRLGGQLRKELSLEEEMKKYNLGAYDEDVLCKAEIAFQKKVTGEKCSLADMREKIGNISYPFRYITDSIECRKQEEQVQIYYDRGHGFSENDSEWIVPTKQEDGSCLVRLEPADDVTAVRLDPANEPCMVQLLEISLQGKDITRNILGKKGLPSSGITAGDGVMVFDHGDPNMTFSIAGYKAGGKCELVLRYELIRMPQHMAKAFQIKKHKIFG